LDIDDIEATEYDYKSKLYQYSQRENKVLEFKLHEQSKRSNRSYFVIHVMVNDRFVAAGEGYSKKVAEQSAALNAVNELGIAKAEPQV
jgi:ribonuclease-3